MNDKCHALVFAARGTSPFAIRRSHPIMVLRGDGWSGVEEMRGDGVAISTL
jgi:hypothetical protein